MSLLPIFVFYIVLCSAYRDVSAITKTPVTNRAWRVYAVPREASIGDNFLGAEPPVAARKGFGPPKPQPSAEEIAARGKRSVQKQKYREMVKLAKTQPSLKKIVGSGVDEKVTDRTNVKGSGGAV
jgi:hypothetical protein